MAATYRLGRRAVAEFIGMYSIVFFGAGAVVIDFLIAQGVAGGEFVASGLGLGALGWIGIAVAFWAAVAIPIYILGPVSGQHINPAVTIAFWLTDRIERTPPWCTSSLSWPARPRCSPASPSCRGSPRSSPSPTS